MFYCGCISKSVVFDLWPADTMAGDDYHLHTNNQVNSPVAILPPFVQQDSQKENIQLHKICLLPLHNDEMDPYIQTYK